MTPESRALNGYFTLSQKSLVDFLHADLDLCLTMLKTAHSASHPEHYHSAIERVRHGLQVIRNLAGRIEIPESWKTFYDRTDVLESPKSDQPTLSALPGHAGFKGFS